MRDKSTIKCAKLLSLLSVLVFMSCGKTQVISSETLLKEMIDKRAVTYFPEQNYTTKQFSSYDRASDKGDANDYTWFANADYSFFLGLDTIDGRIENVMYDAEGPGAITRFWTTIAGAGAGDGVIRIYIDGSDKPVLEGKALDLIGYNKEVGYPLSSALSQTAPKMNRGHNFYMPIPYAKQCKVTYESKHIDHANPANSQLFFYNINYRTYEKSAVVESFTDSTLNSLQGLLKEVNATLLSPNSFAVNNKTSDDRWKETLVAGGRVDNAYHMDNSALSEITIKLKADDMEQALRSTILKISFDNNETVWCPIGDFFATGHIWRNSQTWSTEVDAKAHTLSSTWVMPFKESCEVSIENLGTQVVEIETNLTMCEYAWSKQSMYFGSSWHQYTSISTGINKERKGKGGVVDLNYINLSGKGVFVGDALSIYNPALHGHWKTWWGEGDEKIFVDGEQFPSHFGTGTEDYYGYAWCRPESYSHPFIAQPIGEGNLTAGYTVNSRFRGLDVIPFTKSLELDMELWHWVKTKVNYAPTTFYYMLPGGSTDREIDVKGAKEKIARHRFDILTGETDENGLIEGEDLKIDDSVFPQINGYYHDIFPSGLALQWHQAKQSKTLDTEFNVPQEGEYEVIVGVVKDKDFATVGFSLNGKRAVSSFNCAAKELAVEELSLGRHSLKSKGNKLSVKVNREKNARFAIDYVKIVK